MDLVEKCAEAIYANFFGPSDAAIVNTLGDVVTFSWADAGPSTKEAMRRMARSVLSCIEEEGMVVVPKDRLIHLGRLAKVLPEDCLAYAAISR